MATNEAGEFEGALKRLDEIVQRLERDATVGLEESVKLFREGKTLAERCETLLRDAQRAIESGVAGDAVAVAASPAPAALPPRSVRQPAFDALDSEDADPDL